MPCRALVCSAMFLLVLPCSCVCCRAPVCFVVFPCGMAGLPCYCAFCRAPLCSAKPIPRAKEHGKKNYEYEPQSQRTTVKQDKAHGRIDPKS
eukprot:9296422-Pyramimonas_sp.AAC.1